MFGLICSCARTITRDVLPYSHSNNVSCLMLSTCVSVFWLFLLMFLCFALLSFFPFLLSLSISVSPNIYICFIDCWFCLALSLYCYQFVFFHCFTLNYKVIQQHQQKKWKFIVLYSFYWSASYNILLTDSHQKIGRLSFWIYNLKTNLIRWLNGFYMLFSWYIYSLLLPKWKNSLLLLLSNEQKKKSPSKLNSFYYFIFNAVEIHFKLKKMTSNSKEIFHLKQNISKI